ncbi:hypothetical protein ADEAN_000740400 [Angomonas deanei]|uniref:Leucine Rich repeat n=1 Tax=Angomonas deanei TaxID=59799 RepID=A0A7G2CLU2_9TRYP|nr:hypothetical protein ADEAN_000740400 [Angomonas deanei]
MNSFYALSSVMEYLSGEIPTALAVLSPTARHVSEQRHVTETDFDQVWESDVILQHTVRTYEGGPPRQTHYRSLKVLDPHNGEDLRVRCWWLARDAIPVVIAVTLYETGPPGLVAALVEGAEVLRAQHVPVGLKADLRTSLGRADLAPLSSLFQDIHLPRGYDLPSAMSAFTQLSNVSLVDNHTIQDLSAFTGCAPTLTELLLMDCSALVSLVGLPALTHLTTLTVAGCPLSAETDLTKLPVSLEELFLDGSEIPSLYGVQHCPALRALFLRHLPVTSWEPLLSCRSLRSLSIEDAALSPFTEVSLPQLLSLTLSHTAVGALPLTACSPSLTKVRIQDGTVPLSLAGIEGHPTLELISIAGTETVETEEEIKRLARSCPRLTEVYGLLGEEERYD